MYSMSMSANFCALAASDTMATMQVIISFFISSPLLFVIVSKKGEGWPIGLGRAMFPNMI
jgi:hypothetical protein